MCFLTGVLGACTVSVLQPAYLEVDHDSEAVTMECTFSTTGCSPAQPKSLWFRCGTHQPEALCLDGCRNKADKFTVKETLDQNQVSLTVNRLSPNDSAIYICGIAFPNEKAPSSKQTGNGTTLVVRERLFSKEVYSLLIVLLALLSVYIASVCVIAIVLLKSKSNSPRSRETKEDSKKKSARRIFQEIAQELYHKRYVETSQPQSKTALMKTEKHSPALEEHRYAYFLLNPPTVQLQSLQQCEWTYRNQDSTRESWRVARLAERLPGRHEGLAVIPNATQTQQSDTSLYPSTVKQYKESEVEGHP
ncbi:Immunoglobulin superfamily member 6 [Apodemus speciosus]